MKAQHLSAVSRVTALIAGYALSLSCASIAYPSFAAQSAESVSSSSSCDASYVTAKNLQAHQRSALLPSYTQVAASLSADAWMKVALECSSRYAEGIMYSALAVLSSGLDESGVLAQAAQDQATAQTALFEESTLSINVLSSRSYQALAQAEDRLRFSYEVIATRDASVENAGSYALSSSQASDIFAVHAQKQSTSYKDSRERIYNACQLVQYSGQDGATGLSMPLTASLELDTALTQLRSLDEDSASHSSASLASQASASLQNAIALRVRSHLLRAFALGAPQLSELYLD